MTGFSSLNTAVTGLYAAQRAMDVTGQNIVNANTPGYSRQRGRSHGDRLGDVVVAVHGQRREQRRGERGHRGPHQGRVRRGRPGRRRCAAGGARQPDRRPDRRASSCSASPATPACSPPSTPSTRPGTTWRTTRRTSPPGSVVIQRGISVTDQLRALSDGIAGRWSTAHDALGDVVTQANQAAKDLADVNGKIAAGLVAGRPVNELMDQRDTLRARARHAGRRPGQPGQDGQVSVSVGGVALVAGSTAQQFTLAGATTPGGATASPPGPHVGDDVRAGRVGLRRRLPGRARHRPPRARGPRRRRRHLAARPRERRPPARASRPTARPAGCSSTAPTRASMTVVPTLPAQLAVTPAAGTIDGGNAMKIGDLSDDQVAAAALGHDGPSAQWRDVTTLLGVRVQSLQERHAGAGLGRRRRRRRRSSPTPG